MAPKVPSAKAKPIPGTCNAPKETALHENVPGTVTSEKDTSGCGIPGTVNFPVKSGEGY